ncbi:MAG: ATP-dependent DNA helicase [bacterium]|nr:ATP-dependent DNA helicase [bacterium]
MDINSRKKKLSLSVGELTRLITDSPGSTAAFSFNLRGKLGSAAHRSLQQNHSSATYLSEVALNVTLTETFDSCGVWDIRVRGRLDGVVQEFDRTIIEEIKTVALPKAKFAALLPADYPRHRRQLEIYQYLFALSRPESAVSGRLIYFNLPDRKVRSFDVPYGPAEIRPLLHDVLDELIQRSDRKLRERPQKLQAAADLTFPFPSYRSGQQEIIDAIAETCRNRRSLLIEAPTGLGKTAAVLHAATRLALQDDLQIVYLTSKNTQQEQIFKSVSRLISVSIPRIVWLRAKPKMCLKTDPACRPEECEYFSDLRQRLRESPMVDDFLQRGAMHPDEIIEAGKHHKLCPYEIQLAFCQEADLIIGDYNYVFDPDCRLAQLFDQGDPERLLLIVDEAHNLPPRARTYYSTALTWSEVESAIRKLKSERVKRFDDVFSLIQAQFEHYLSHAPQEDPYPIQLSNAAWGKVLKGFEEAVVPYWYRLTAKSVPLEDHPVIVLQRSLERFNRILNIEGENFAHLVRRSPQPALEILCLDAAPQLQETFQQVHSAVCLSATLQPPDAHVKMLGLAAETEILVLPSPFPAENLRILIDPTVTTLYRKREENLSAIASRIDRFFALMQKNTLAFFPSFELMRRISALLDAKPIFIQSDSMSESQRSEMIAAFTDRSPALLCSVMGGIFAEGIDLPGKLAEAAVIVGVGLPQVSTEVELIRAYHDRRGDSGFDYAYLYPGMRRMIQAAGRIIRTPSDRGVILLLDVRYTQRSYQQLLPRHWYHTHPAELICEEWEGRVG